MFIVVKIKCVNSDKISDICGKVNFTTNYMHFTTPNILSKHTQILQFLIFLMGTAGPKNLPKERSSYSKKKSSSKVRSAALLMEKTGTAIILAEISIISSFLFD